MKRINRTRSRWRQVGLILIGIPSCCLLLAGGLALSNLRLPKHSFPVETLSDADKARLAEFQHLRTTLGDAVWPGWGHTDIPVILYNEKYAFLVGDPNPADGWIKVPAGSQQGVSWELTASDDFFGIPYHRQELPDPEVTPEAFTVKVGDRWVASLTTLDWFKIEMRENIRNDLPAFLHPIFPYDLFLKQLVSGSDQYVSLIAHEAFHAFQGAQTPGKLAASEFASFEFEKQYPWSNADLQEDWQTELELLKQALRSTDESELRLLVGQFLNLRLERREQAGMSGDLIAYEQQREWLEGLARYAELELWRQASIENYQPVPEVVSLTDFKNYTGYPDRWKRELDQISRTADDTGDGRFYYSGMAQAFLLDRLLPGWKLRAFEENVWLDELLADAVGLQD